MENPDVIEESSLSEEFFDAAEEADLDLESEPPKEFKVVLEVRNSLLPTRPSGPSRWDIFLKSIYNPATGKFFGRTGLEWARLSLFYAVFYAVLAGIFGMGFGVLFITLDVTEPKYQLQQSLIGANPGLGFRPLRWEEGSLIWYNYEDPSSTEKWVNLLDAFMEPYERNYTGQNVQDCSFGKSPQKGCVCTVDQRQFGPCSREKKYGYNSTSPCVFIKLNKIFGWKPDFYTKPEKGMPRDLQQTILKLPQNKRKQIWISCRGEEPADRENIVGFNYYPGPGFPGYYYPYLNVKNYLSPLIAVEIVNLRPNIVVSIECRAWAKNIFYKKHPEDRQGSVHFEILIDEVERHKHGEM